MVDFGLVRNNRLVDLDVLRGFAIVLIVFGHLAGGLVFAGNGVFNYFLYNVSEPVAEFGVSLFIFVSGFSLHINNRNIASQTKLRQFFKKRFIRIYPLYWTALVIDLIMFQLFYLTSVRMNLSASDIIIHFAGLQTVLSPRYTGLYMLWFVSLIVFFYLLYPALSIFSNSAKRFAVVTIGVFLALVAVRTWFDILDVRIFIYYWIFVGGIICNQYNLISTRKVKYFGLFSAVVLLLPVILYAIYSSYGFNTFLTDRLYIHLVLNIVVALCVFPFYWIVARTYAAWNKHLLGLFLFLSFSAYCIYLYHFAFLQLAKSLSSHIPVASFGQDIILLIVGLPALALASFCVQRGYNNLISRVIVRRR